MVAPVPIGGAVAPVGYALDRVDHRGARVRQQAEVPAHHPVAVDPVPEGAQVALPRVSLFPVALGRESYGTGSLTQPTDALTRRALDEVALLIGRDLGRLGDEPSLIERELPASERIVRNRLLAQTPADLDRRRGAFERDPGGCSHEVRDRLVSTLAIGAARVDSSSRRRLAGLRDLAEEGSGPNPNTRSVSSRAMGDLL